MWCQGLSILIKKYKGAFSAKGKADLYFFNKNLVTNLYIEILEFSLPEMNKIMKNSVILQFDNDPKQRSLKALEFYKVKKTLKLLIDQVIVQI